jgi:hypothetical protein
VHLLGGDHTRGAVAWPVGGVEFAMSARMVWLRDLDWVRGVGLLRKERARVEDRI